MPYDVYNKTLYKPFNILMNEKVFMNECMHGCAKRDGKNMV